MRERKPMSTEYLKVLVSDLKCDGDRYQEFHSARVLRSMSSVKWRLSPRGFAQALSHAVKLLPSHGWTAERRRGKRGWEYRFRRHEPAYDGPMMTPEQVGKLVKNLRALSPHPGANIRCDCGAILGPLKIGKEKYKCSCGEVWLVDFDGFHADTTKEVTPPDSCGHHGEAGRVAEVKEPQEVWVVRERRDGKPPRSMAVYDSQDEAFQMARSEAMKGRTGVETGAYVPRVHHVEAFPDFSGGLHVAPPPEEYKCREIMDPNKWMTTIPVSDVRKKILDILMDRAEYEPGLDLMGRLIKWLRELEG